MSNELDKQLRAIAQKMEYPPTPVIRIPAKSTSTFWLRRYAWQTALVALVLLSSLFIFEPARATVSEWLGIGGLQIVPADQAPPADVPLIEAMTLSQKTTLADAHSQVAFTLRYPTEIGLPDEVYLVDKQLISGVIMVWRDADSQEINYALYQLTGSQGFYKGQDFIQTTRVDESPNVAFWLEQPHTFWLEQIPEPKSYDAYLIEEPVLIWEYTGILHRFESSLTLREALIIANSMTDIDPE